MKCAMYPNTTIIRKNARNNHAAGSAGSPVDARTIVNNCVRSKVLDIPPKNFEIFSSVFIFSIPKFGCNIHIKITFV
jgi:hypothetical protein